jgi:hypothetical protein
LVALSVGGTIHLGLLRQTQAEVTATGILLPEEVGDAPFQNCVAGASCALHPQFRDADHVEGRC